MQPSHPAGVRGLKLYREGYYNPGFLNCDEADWVTDLEVAKNRQRGNAGKYTLALFQQPYMQCTICPSDLAEKYMKKVKRNG